MTKSKNIPKTFQLDIGKIYDFSDQKKLFRLGIKVNTPYQCNLTCPYCYEVTKKTRTLKIEDNASKQAKISDSKSWFNYMVS